MTPMAEPNDVTGTPSPQDRRTVRPGGSGPNRVVVEAVSGPHAGERHEFSGHQTLVVGRAAAAQLSLNRDPYFSRHHFCLEINPPDCFFRDLGSRNGTYLNGERCTERRLRDGDVISGGSTRLTVSLTQEACDTAPGALSVTSVPGRGGDGGQGDGGQSDGPAAGDPSFQMVPGYEVFEEIGRGGMGAVYRAIQKSTAKQVALKVILPMHAVEEDANRFFIREASLLGQLDHPRIVRFHEFGMAAGQLFLAMEYVPKIDLQEILRTQSEPSRIRICCAIACQVLEALSYAHTRSLVHRDIKPSNILVYQPQQKLRVKLADFGLTKNYMNAGFSGMTLEGDIRGTLRYIPPEQVIDSRYAKPASDIYALGATLYEYLCGKPPFDYAVGQKQILAILEEDAPPLRERCPRAPAELATILERALAKDPLNRFSSAEEMRQALLPFSKRKRG